MKILTRNNPTAYDLYYMANGLQKEKEGRISHKAIKDYCNNCNVEYKSNNNKDTKISSR